MFWISFQHCVTLILKLYIHNVIISPCLFGYHWTLVGPMFVSSYIICHIQSLYVLVCLTVWYVCINDRSHCSISLNYTIVITIVLNSLVPFPLHHCQPRCVWNIVLWWHSINYELTLAAYRQCSMVGHQTMVSTSMCDVVSMLIYTIPMML